MATRSREATLLEQIRTARDRFDDLYHRAAIKPVDETLLNESLEELSTAHEELRVAMEELRWQNDELIATRSLAEEQRRHYRELFEFAPDGYLVTDTAGIIQEANHKAGQILGVRDRFLMGKPMIIFIPEPEHKAFHELLARLESDAEVPSCEMRMKPRDGLPFPAAVSVSVIRQSAPSGWRPIGLRWLVRDITNQKKSDEQIESQLRRITGLHEINKAITSTLDLESVLDLLLEEIEDFFHYPTATTVRIFNQKTGEMERVLCRNIPLEEWKGYGRPRPGSRADEVIRSKAPVVATNLKTDPRSHRHDFYVRNGLSSYLAVPLTIKDQVMGILCVYTKEEHDFSQEEVVFLSSLATQAAMTIHNSQLYEQLKEQTAELENSREQLEERVRERTFELAATNEMLTAEVGERRRIEEKLRQSEGRLSELAKRLEQQLIASDRLVSVGELAASVAHEFNNPLQIIMGFAQELLQETKPSQPHHEPLTIIEAETRRCREIIRNLLDFARPVEAERVLTPVEPIVQNGLQLVYHYLQMSKVKVAIDIEPNLPPIHADAQQLQQV
ncbi:MAG: GAF domain-containing protein, partial [Candidatus Binatia bacterium]